MGISENDSTVKVAFGCHLRRLRTERGYSQEQFANEAGLDRSYIGGVERGVRNISLVNIAKIAVALNLTIEKLFEGFDG